MDDKAPKQSFMMRDFTGKPRLVRGAIGECPANAECFRLMSYVDLQLNRRTQAVQPPASSAPILTHDENLYLAFALYRSYQFEEAMHAAETALELCPDYAYGMAVASSIKQSLNDKEGALQYAELGLAIDPDCDSCLKRRRFCSGDLTESRRSRSSREKLFGVGPK
ncbi:MAG: tetratricopeptide repeat protein [Candidatus Obscuribacter sp.]|nr:tetratricopeptide repeat protein [Candidatus Obscuribacter sp.]